MKHIEMFGRRIPVSILIATIVLAAVGAGVMVSQFGKGPGTFYATGKASISQLPNRVEVNSSIAINPVNSTPATESLEDVFTIFHRNNRLVLVEVKLINEDMLRKYFDDFVVLIRQHDNETLLATLTLNSSSDTFIDTDPNAASGIKYRADIIYTAKNGTPAVQIPVIIAAEVSSQ